jgi:hypothetical protein
MAQIIQFPKNPNQTPDTGFTETEISSSEKLYKGQNYTHLISTNQDLLETFMYNCDPKLREWELMHWGITDFDEILTVNPSQLEDTIKKLQNSPFYFPENSENTQFIRNLKVEDSEISNYLMNNFELNNSKLTSLAYARVFNLFFDRYNNTFELESEKLLFTSKQIRLGLMKENNQYNQETLNTILEFPQINQENLDYFLQFWKDIKFNDETTTY